MDNAENASTGDDSDNDVVTDFLNSNCAIATDASNRQAINGGHDNSLSSSLTAQPPNSINNHNSGNNHPNLNITSQTRWKLPRVTIESQNYCIPIMNAPPPIVVVAHSAHVNHNNNNNNMIPTINITPHSPALASKYNNIFEDTLSQLQNIRETVVQMKNSSAQMQDTLSNYGLINAAILSASLPDLTASNGSACNTGAGPHYVMWNTAPHHTLLNTDRRKSWTAVDELNAGNDCTNKSVSLSSLDSEEQETIRVTESRRRSARNSTGGISTHSLNEAELARDFERIAAKRTIANEIISRIPLQKSISTSSIIAKDDIKTIARHLTDSEDENQSLLRAHPKTEVYDNVEKRRKRGSLFFRKKKDKTKMKTIGGQLSACDICGTNITLSQLKEHQTECSGARSKRLLSGAAHDYIDAADGQPGQFNDETPLIRAEFLNDTMFDSQDLCADTELGIVLKEHDSWTPGVPKELLKTMQELQIKRQEHIYEFIMTEKHHCQTLLVMQKVFVECLKRHFPSLNVNSMFPHLDKLTELHTGFLKKLRQKQREHHVVDSIADILLDFFALEQDLRVAYGEFCANHCSALKQFKECTKERLFGEWYKRFLTNPLLKKKGIPECILFVTQRLTKYPLLIEPLLKCARDNKIETDKLQGALNSVKELLRHADACVALRERQLDIYERIDDKSFAIYKNKPFSKSELSVDARRLKFAGHATLMKGNIKIQKLLVVVLSDCLCFLSENSTHNKSNQIKFYTPERRAGVVPLQELILREMGNRIYIVNTAPDWPEMYDLEVKTQEEKKQLMDALREAMTAIKAEEHTADEKLRIGMNKSESIQKMRQRDIEQAMLLEEKLLLQLDLLKDRERQMGSGANIDINTHELGASKFLDNISGAYKNLVSDDCDTAALWKRVLSHVQEISQLAANIYHAATGVPVSRALFSGALGEKTTISEHHTSPTLPKRAETFAGFDEKRGKHVTTAGGFPCRDAAKLATLLSPRLQELEEKREHKITTGNSGVGPTLLQDVTGSSSTLETTTMREHNYSVLQVAHNLHTLLCIISQQMTSIQSLQLQLALYRENPRAVYTHNDQLEELRNLQEKLQEEKTAWLKQKEQQERELAETRAQQIKIQSEIKIEQEDIKQQREQLYRKMELLSSQGLLLSPSTPLPFATNSPTTNATTSVDGHERQEGDATNATININNSASTMAGSTVDRRKDKWRTASTISKTPPVNLLSATNAPKINQTCVKQKLPMKLSSLSSSTAMNAKIDKSASFNANTTHLKSTAAGVTQIFPLKLADKRIPTTISTAPTSSSALTSTSTSTSTSSAVSNQSILVPQHGRTGSSPAIIQHPSGDSSRGDNCSQKQQRISNANTHFTPTSSRMMAQTPGDKQIANTTTPIARTAPHASPEEEEIYF